MTKVHVFIAANDHRFYTMTIDQFQELENALEKAREVFHFYNDQKSAHVSLYAFAKQGLLSEKEFRIMAKYFDMQISAQLKLVSCIEVDLL